MKRDFDLLANGVFDVVVVGGGIIGTGVTRDAALRGLKTLLIEKEDFSSGTTSRSTRLIHGGLRYLQHLEFGLVRTDMRERETLLKIAPHLVQPLPFLIPLVKPVDRLVMSLGTLAYDILSYDKSLPGRRHYSLAETRKMEPTLKLPGLRGSELYYDCQVWYAERLCLENVISAAENGAVTLNHARVTGLIKNENTVTGVKLQDTISGKDYEVRSRMVVNAAGHWMDEICGMAYAPPKPLLRRTKGTHLFTPRISNHALVLFAKSDGRLWFVIPWNNYSIIGTTDTDYTGDPEAVYAEKQDVDYILSEAQRAFPNLKAGDIFFTHAGLRSLPFTGDAKPSNVSRAHLILDHRKTNGIQGFISVLGGKITAYRAISEEVTDVVCKQLQIKTACKTAYSPLPGAPSVSAELLTQYGRDSGLPEDTLTHLAEVYGSRMPAVLDLIRKNPRGKQPLCVHSQDILAQVWFAIAEENTLTLSDFMFRRSGLGLAQCQGTDAAETVNTEMAGILGWNAAEQQRQLDAYYRSADLGQRFRQ